MQNENSYNVYYNGTDATRLVKGTINLYEYWLSRSGTSTLDVYYILEVSPFNFVEATFSNMDRIFADKPGLVKKYHELFPIKDRKGRNFPIENMIKKEEQIRFKMIDLIKMYNEELAK